MDTPKNNDPTINVRNLNLTFVSRILLESASSDKSTREF